MRRGGGHKYPAFGVIVLGLAAAVLTGCGGGEDAKPITATFARFEAALRQRDAARACRQITSDYWSALAREVNAELVASSREPVSTSDCRVGLERLLSLAGTTSLAKSGFAVTAVAVHGKTATARLSVGGSDRGPIKFVDAAGGWRIDCCAGEQVAQQPRAVYRVPSGSMLPTLRVGQIVVSDNATLRSHPPSLGSIVVFHPPAGADAATPTCGTAREGAGSPRPCGVPTPRASRQTFIKRVVGLPGDRIAIVDGRVIRNGSPEPQPYKIEPCAGDPSCNFPDAVVIPPNDYFVLGDNRAASDDSRYWGPVKKSWLVGLVQSS